MNDSFLSFLEVNLRSLYVRYVRLLGTLEDYDTSFKNELTPVLHSK